MTYKFDPRSITNEPSAFSTSTQAPIAVGVDDGHYAVKVCAGPDRFFSIESRSHPGRLAITEFDKGEESSGLIYETASGEFVTITANYALAPAVDTRADDYPTSSPNRALVTHSLKGTGFDAQDPLLLVSGLPVDRFYQGGQLNSELIEAKRASLLRPVNDASGKQVVQVVKHLVISEAVAAYYDALLDFNGAYNQDFKDLSDEEPVAVIDAGGKTLDIATVKEGGQGLYQQYSGTAEVGALFVYDRISTAIMERFSLQDPIPFVRLRRAIETGTYRLYGESHDVRALVDEQLDEFARRVNFEVGKLLGDASRFGQVIFVGGGANLLRSRLELVFPGLPQSAITIAKQSDDPATDSAFANARGMYKAAVLAASDS